MRLTRSRLIRASTGLCCRVSRDTLSCRSAESTTPFDEPQVARHQAFQVAGDEHPVDIELEAVLLLRVVQIERRRARQEQQRLVGDHALGLDVEATPGLVERMADVVVELGVLLVGDLGLGPGPKGARLVDLLRLLGLGVLVLDRPRCRQRRRPGAGSAPRCGRNSCARPGAGGARPGTRWHRRAASGSPRCRVAPPRPWARSCSRCGHPSASASYAPRRHGARSPRPPAPP